MSLTAKARDVPFLPVLGILTGIVFLIGGVSSIIFLLLPDIGDLLGVGWLVVGWLHAVFLLLVGIGWIVAGLLWHFRKS